MTMGSPLPLWSMNNLRARPWITVASVEATETRLTAACGDCDRVAVMIVRNTDLRRWTGGELIQNVWPSFSDEQRELLITGTCSACFPIGDE